MISENKPVLQGVKPGKVVRLARICSQESPMNPKLSEATLEELQQEICTLRNQLSEAQKQTALGELVGTTTHEFNNALMTIINYARMGMRHTDEPTRTKAFEKILTASGRANKITNSILGMAKNRSNRFETTCLRTIIDESMVLMEREMQKYRIAVDYDFAEVPAVRAVGNQIQQILTNLLINARQAMQKGGRLIIRLAHDEAAGLVDLTVRDFGEGIPRDKLHRIFDSGFTTKSGPDESGTGGSGLGLYTCKNIMDSHQGKIRVESTVGKGTAFTLRLPVMKMAGPLPIPKALSDQSVSTATA